jgi:hypothetical protein
VPEVGAGEWEFLFNLGAPFWYRTHAIIFVFSSRLYSWLTQTPRHKSKKPVI